MITVAGEAQQTPLVKPPPDMSQVLPIRLVTWVPGRDRWE